MWILFAILSAICASIMTILMKKGLSGNMNANLASAIRTTLVMVLGWILVISTNVLRDIRNIDGKTWWYLIFAAIATFGTWTFYFLALKNGRVSQVHAIDRLSIVLTIVLSVIFLKESITFLQIVGIVVMLGGTMLVIL